MNTLKTEVKDVLVNNILPFWLKMEDQERGGFYGQMTGMGELRPNANRGCILNARILWSFSAAYRVLKRIEYLEAATRAKDYILQHFVDPVYGGTYWEVDADGKPIDTKKQFYAIGFAIYGLSEYARATAGLYAQRRQQGGLSAYPTANAQEALDMALALYEDIEQFSWDQEFGGYIEACTREWGKIEDMRLSELDANYPKSQNTHLHIIEPYTNLYRAMKECSELKVSSIQMLKVEKSLRSLIDIFCNKILNPETHHLDLFFEMDWKRGAGHLESYGHDIECSWLMHESALVLGDPAVLRQVEPIVQMVARASEKGLNADGSMTHEANLDTGHVDADRHWWVQAETVVGFYNIYQHFGDHSALEKSLRCWEYIKNNLIDNTLGEWYWSRDPQRNINLKDDHAGFWKCPYHNSRMCLELMERIP